MQILILFFWKSTDLYIKSKYSLKIVDLTLYLAKMCFIRSYSPYRLLLFYDENKLKTLEKHVFKMFVFYSETEGSGFKHTFEFKAFLWR